MRDKENRITRELRSRTDQLVGKGGGSVALALFVAVVGLGLLSGTVRYLVGAREGESYAEAVWQGFNRLLDPGALQGDVSLIARLESVLFTLLGILAAAAITAIVIAEFQLALDRARNGRTVLREPCDVVLLGWSANLEEILVEFDASASTRCVAILSSRSRAEAQDEVNALRKRTGIRIRVHCRQGDPVNSSDLKMIRIEETRAVVIVAGDTVDDSEVIKGVFALTKSGVDLSAQAVLAEVKTEEAANAIRMVTRGRVKTVNAQEVIALVLAQAVRDIGMSQVIQELFSYKGCELYFHPLPGVLIGETFGTCVLSVQNARPIGFVRDGETHVNPTFVDPLLAGDEIIVVQQEWELLEVNETLTQFGVDQMSAHSTGGWPSQNVLVVGWSTVLESTLQHLLGFLGRGSTIGVAVMEARMGPGESASLRRAENSGLLDYVVYADRMQDLAEHVLEMITDRAIDALAILPHREQLTSAQADADTLVILAAIQNQRSHFDSALRVVAELREASAGNLASTVSDDDFIISQSLAASLMVQLVDRPELDQVLADLLDFHGSAIFVRHREHWPSLDGAKDIGFDEVTRAVMASNELPIGWRVGGTIELDPPSSARVDSDQLSAIVVIGTGAQIDAASSAITTSDVGARSSAKIQI